MIICRFQWNLAYIKKNSASSRNQTSHTQLPINFRKQLFFTIGCIKSVVKSADKMNFSDNTDIVF